MLSDSSIIELAAFAEGIEFFVLDWRESSRIQEIEINAINDSEAGVRGGQQLDVIICHRSCFPIEAQTSWIVANVFSLGSFREPTSIWRRRIHDIYERALVRV